MTIMLLGYFVGWALGGLTTWAVCVVLWRREPAKRSGLPRKAP